MTVGPGLAAWIQQHQATALEDEYGVGSPWRFSSVPIEIANALGQKTHAVVSWDHGLNAVIEPGAGPVVASAAPPAVMYDSTTAADIPADAQVVAGYVDGLYAWRGLPEVPSGDWARFPNARRITITVNGANLADVCDCETGDLTPEQAATWIENFPGNIVYCNLSTAPAVVAAMQAAGLTQYKLWIADWTGRPHMPSVAGADVVACQYADPATGSGGHYDLSLVTAEFLATF